MNRGRISTQVFLCFLVMMFLMVIGCSKSDDTLPTYNISGTVSGATAVTINLTGAATATTTTDASGNYSFTGRTNGTYTVTPVKAGYIFNPVSSVVAVSGANVTGRNFVATTYDGLTYSISGTISGAASSGVTITLSGANTASVVTVVGGTYSISGLVPGSYTVTPSLTGFTFDPTSTAATITAANSTTNNFVATAIPVAHSISGTVTALGVPLSGVNITVTGTATTTATTNASGVFNVTGLYDGSYTLTPSKTGYTFSSVSLTVTVSGADIAGKDFTATANAASTYTISGAVSGDVLSGVTISLSGSDTGSITTNISGNYSFSGILPGSYTVTPSKTGYTFSPANAAANVSGANVTVANFVATAISPIWSQADLTGTWYMNNLRTGRDSGGNKWLRAMFSINASGVATCLSMSDSGGGTTCPSSVDMTLTMNSSTGVITQTGADAGDAGTNHMTMTSNKNFAAGTGTNTGGSNPRYQLTTMQKVVPGTVYTNAGVQSKSFVYHQLRVGSNNEWEYGTGTTGATGAITITSATMPSGTDAPGSVGTMSLDSDGVVTMSGTDMATFQGFLSDDKKTIVGTQTNSSGSGSTSYGLMIIQITGQTYTAGLLPAGTSAAHMLACGSAPAPLWLHHTSNVANGGVITSSDWVSSNSNFADSGTARTGSISSLGTVTIDGISSFHGQVSDDGKFTVATQTITNGAYALQVTTK